MDTLPIILILALILLIFFYKHQEKFTVNPLRFMGKDYDPKNPNYTNLRDMRKFRKCNNVRNKTYCILKKKPFTTHLEIKKFPYRKYVNYPVTRNVRDLFPQDKEPLPFIT